MNVVIVDDEAIVRHGIRHSINWTELGVSRVEEAENGQEVWERWPEWEPDLIVTDIKMPVMDGITLIRKAKERRPDCLCVVLSCADEFQLVKEALLVGASDYLLKMTVRPEELMDCMRKVTALYRGSTVGAASPPTSRGEHQTAFLRQVFTGRYDTAEIADMARECGMGKHLQHFAVAIVQWWTPMSSSEDRETSNRQARLPVLEQWLQKAEQADELRRIPTNEGEYVLLLNLRMRMEAESAPEQQYSQLVSRLGAMLSNCSNQGRPELRCGISNETAGSGELLSAYYEARRAIEQLLLYTGRQLLLYSQSQAHVPAHADRDVRAQFEQSFRLKLTQALMSGTLTEAESTIDHHFGLLAPASCSANTARDCIDKAAAIMRVIVMEMNSLAPHDKQGYISLDHHAGEQPFPMHWSCQDTAEHFKSYCRYLFDRRIRQQESGSRRTIQDIQLYLRERYSDHVTLEETARQFYLNKNYLSQLFKTETGINFTRYLNGIRVKKAKELILNTPCSIQDIAEKTGFGDSRYFSRVFRSHTGLSPSEFKGGADQSSNSQSKSTNS